MRRLPAFLTALAFLAVVAVPAQAKGPKRAVQQAPASPAPGVVAGPSLQGVAPTSCVWIATSAGAAYECQYGPNSSAIWSQMGGVWVLWAGL